MPRPAAAPPGHILMGRIGAAHGVRGEVRINSFTADPLAIVDFSPLATGQAGLTVAITSARPQKNVIVATLEGVTDRNGAEALNGVELYAPRDALPAPGDADEFYHADLIGLDARLAGGETLGMVVAVHNFGAGDTLEIAPRGAPSVLVPFTRAVVPEVEIAGGYLVVDPPPGLLAAGSENQDGQEAEDEGTAP
jgi:16S rRNA processing protein RimM